MVVNDPDLISNNFKVLLLMTLYMLLVLSGVTSSLSGLSYLLSAPDKYIFIIFTSYLALLKPTTGCCIIHILL